MRVRDNGGLGDVLNRASHGVLLVKVLLSVKLIVGN